MGKFYEALRRSGTLKERDSPASPPDNVVKISPQTVQAPEADLSGSQTIAEGPPARHTEIDTRLVCLLDPEAAASECYKMLRTKLMVIARERPLRAIMVTSAEPTDGKSLTAANLAVSIAQGVNDHVVLVDCDLRAPSLHSLFDLKVQFGFEDYLRGAPSIAPFLVKTPLEKLTLLPAGRPSANPSELLCSRKMQALIDELKSRYADRFVIFDSPPGQFAAETTFLSRLMDGVILVVRYGKTPRDKIMETIENMGKEKLLGVVFNASHQIERSSRYYYRYYRNRRS